MEIAPSDSNVKVLKIFKWKNKVLSNDGVYNCMFQCILKHIVEPIDFIFTALVRCNSHTITAGMFKCTESVIFSVSKVV